MGCSPQGSGSAALLQSAVQEDVQEQGDHQSGQKIAEPDAIGVDEPDTVSVPCRHCCLNNLDMNKYQKNGFDSRVDRLARAEAPVIFFLEAAATPSDHNQDPAARA